MCTVSTLFLSYTQIQFGFGKSGGQLNSTSHSLRLSLGSPTSRHHWGGHMFSNRTPHNLNQFQIEQFVTIQEHAAYILVSAITAGNWNAVNSHVDIRFTLNSTNCCKVLTMSSIPYMLVRVVWKAREFLLQGCFLPNRVVFHLTLSLCAHVSLQFHTP